MYCEESSEKHRLQAGRTLMLMLPAGHELYCVQGQASVMAAPKMVGDSLTARVRMLSVGQAWRSGETQWITVRNDDPHAACMIVHVQPLAQLSEAPRQNSLAASATRLFQETMLWIKRGLSAASVKTP